MRHSHFFSGRAETEHRLVRLQGFPEAGKETGAKPDTKEIKIASSQDIKDNTQKRTDAAFQKMTETVSRYPEHGKELVKQMTTDPNGHKKLIHVKIDEAPEEEPKTVGAKLERDIRAQMDIVQSAEGDADSIQRAVAVVTLVALHVQKIQLMMEGKLDNALGGPYKTVDAKGAPPATPSAEAKDAAAKPSGSPDGARPDAAKSENPSKEIAELEGKIKDIPQRKAVLERERASVVTGMEALQKKLKDAATPADRKSAREALAAEIERVKKFDDSIEGLEAEQKEMADRKFALEKELTRRKAVVDRLNTAVVEKAKVPGIKSIGLNADGALVITCNKAVIDLADKDVITAKLKEFMTILGDKAKVNAGDNQLIATLDDPRFWTELEKLAKLLEDKPEAPRQARGEKEDGPQKSPEKSASEAPREATLPLAPSSVDAARRTVLHEAADMLRRLGVDCGFDSARNRMLDLYAKQALLINALARHPRELGIFIDADDNVAEARTNARVAPPADASKSWKEIFLMSPRMALRMIGAYSIPGGPDANPKLHALQASIQQLQSGFDAKGIDDMGGGVRFIRAAENTREESAQRYQLGALILRSRALPLRDQEGQTTGYQMTCKNGAYFTFVFSWKDAAWMGKEGDASPAGFRPVTDLFTGNPDADHQEYNAVATLLGKVQGAGDLTEVYGDARNADARQRMLAGEQYVKMIDRLQNRIEVAKVHIRQDLQQLDPRNPDMLWERYKDRVLGPGLKIDWQKGNWLPSIGLKEGLADRLKAQIQAEKDAIGRYRGALGMLAPDLWSQRKTAIEQLTYLKSVNEQSKDPDYAAFNKSLDNLQADLRKTEAGIKVADTALGAIASAVPYGGLVYTATRNVTGYVAGEQKGVDPWTELGLGSRTRQEEREAVPVSDRLIDIGFSGLLALFGGKNPAGAGKEAGKQLLTEQVRKVGWRAALALLKERGKKQVADAIKSEATDICKGKLKYLCGQIFIEGKSPMEVARDLTEQEWGGQLTQSLFNIVQHALIGTTLEPKGSAGQAGKKLLETGASAFRKLLDRLINTEADRAASAVMGN